MTILLNDARIRAVPLAECGEPLVPVPSRLPETGRDGVSIWVRAGVAQRLRRSAGHLPVGWGLRLNEGHRSPSDQKGILDAYAALVAAQHPDASALERDQLTSRFVAPLEVAPHVAGAAVDLTLTGPDGRDLDLGTPIDATPESSGGACYTDWGGLSKAARRHRSILGEVLGEAGLINYPTEWWHWSFGDRYWALLTGAPAAPYGPIANRVPVLTIDLDAVAANVRYLVATTPGVRAVVKADAFGHGSTAVARTALESGARSLGVATLDEALALRGAGFGCSILTWLNPVDANWEAALVAGIEIGVPSLAHLDRVAQTATRRGVRAQVHLVLDCGLARDGAAVGEWEGLCATAAAAEVSDTIEVVGIMGHLACAEDPDHTANASGRDRFSWGLSRAYAAGLHPRERHLAATAAALHDPASHHTGVRVGAGLYGIAPGHRGTPHPLTPAMRLAAPVVAIRDVPAGTGVGYGHTWHAPRDTRLATIALGYADGLPRITSGRAEVVVHGQRCPVVGRISMDQCTIDVGDLPVTLGDEVTVWGGHGPRLAEWAAWADTLDHEICTGVGARVARVLRPALPTLAAAVAS